MKRGSLGFGVLLLMIGMLSVIGRATPVSAQEDPTCFGEDVTIEGTGGTINGTNGNDVILGTSGGETINGKGGHDIICGEGGDDTVKGGNGNDLIFGGPGSDKLHGEAGNDVIFGDADDEDVEESDYDTGWYGYYPEEYGLCSSDQEGYGDDTLTGGNNDDTLLDVCGNNVGDGGSGSDIVEISGTAKGGTGNDPAVWAYGGLWDNGEYSSLADGGSGHDEVYAQNGKAVGGSGNDEVYVEGEGGVAEGNTGNDFLGDESIFTRTQEVYTDAVTLNGGTGNDTCLADDNDTVISCEHFEGPA